MKANTAANAPKTYKEGTLTYLPLSRIVKHPDMIYRDIETSWVEELSANIEQVGLTVPLIVWNGGGEAGTRMQIGDGEKVPASFLVGGLHRLTALKALFKRSVAKYKELFPNGVPVIVVGGSLSDAIAAMLRENVMREDMPHDQILPALEYLIKKEAKGGAGMTQKEIAKAIGRSTAWVSQILSIRENLGEEGAEALKKGKIGLSEAREAAAEVSKARKAGKPVDPKAALEKVSKKAEKRKAENRQREARKVSAVRLWKRYQALPKMKMADQIVVLESALGYLANDPDTTLSEELTTDADEGKDEGGDESEE